MGYVCTANGKGVAITADSQYREFVVGNLDSRCYRQRAAMQRVKTVSVQKKWKTRSAAYTGNNGYILLADLELVDRNRYAIDDTEIPATRTPGG